MAALEDSAAVMADAGPSGDARGPSDGRGHGAGLDAQLLLLRFHVDAATRTWLLAHDDARCLASRPARGTTAQVRGAAPANRASRLPARRARVPRPDLQVDARCSCRGPIPKLVDWAIELGRRLAAIEQPAVLDLGTGSGAIALAVAPLPLGCAVDASPMPAGRRAQTNASGSACRRVPPPAPGGRPWRIAASTSRSPTRPTSPADPNAPGGADAEPHAGPDAGPEGLTTSHHRRGQRRLTSKPAAGCCWSTASTRPAVRRCLRDAGFARIATRRTWPR